MSVENEDPSEAPRADRPNPHAGQQAAQQAAHQAGREARQKAEFILSRAYGLLREPKSEWKQIRDEETNIPSLMLGYVAPLAAVPPVAGLVGLLAFGRGLSGTPAQIFVGAIISFLVFMALIFFLGYLIGAIAENFEGERNELRAMKVAAYAPTPAFLLGVFSVWPPFWWVGLIGVAAAAFLLFRGLPILMKAPEDRALSYAATVAVTGLIVLIVLGVLTSCVTGVGRL